MRRYLDMIAEPGNVIEVPAPQIRQMIGGRSDRERTQTELKTFDNLPGRILATRASHDNVMRPAAIGVDQFKEIALTLFPVDRLTAVERKAGRANAVLKPEIGLCVWV